MCLLNYLVCVLLVQGGLVEAERVEGLVVRGLVPSKRIKTYDEDVKRL